MKESAHVNRNVFSIHVDNPVDTARVVTAMYDARYVDFESKLIWM